MLNGRKIAVVLPAYNAEQTLEKTFREVPEGIVDDFILTDDASRDNTAEAARRLGVSTKTIKRRIADGTLKSTKIAGVRPIDAESVKALFGPEKPCKQEHR